MNADCFTTGPVAFGYGNKPFLNTGSIDLPRGKVTVIAGENGSGKTTWLKLIAGLLNPAGGSNAGQELNARSIYLSQDPYLFRGSVARNLRLALQKTPRLPDHERDQRIGDALDSVGLSGFETRNTRDLSGGECSRVALARTLLSDKPLLLLDEPAAHADAASVRRIEAACRRFASQGRAVVVATHRGGFGYRVADSLYELAEGRLEPSAANLLRGSVARRDDGFIHFTSGDATFRAPMRDGEFTVAVVAAEDVLLSPEPLRSSARNRLQGRIASISERSDGTLLVTIECGMQLKARITPEAMADMAKDMAKTLHFVNVSGGAFTDITSTVMTMEYETNVSAPAAASA